MGLLVDGKWVDQWYDTKSSGGRFVRQDSAFRNWVTPDGSPGPSGNGGFKAEADRYHLYVAYACPWAHRAMIFRTLKGLEGIISVSFVHWLMGDEGWTFDQDPDGIVGDHLGQASRLYEIYVRAQSDYSGRATVPVLWDKKTGTIISNESSEIIRMFNSAFDGVGATPGDYYPEALRDDIDAVNDRIYHTLNNGVYKAGFATTQEAYDEAVVPLFDTLDWLEDRLGAQRYLNGPRMTEADWRLFPTLVRFDPVYVGHFKCDKRRIADYPNLSNYLRDLYQQQGIRHTINMEHVRKHYYASHKTINPHGIVPLGPDQDLLKPHDRDRF